MTRRIVKSLRFLGQYVAVVLVMGIGTTFMWYFLVKRGEPAADAVYGTAAWVLPIVASGLLPVAAGVLALRAWHRAGRPAWQAIALFSGLHLASAAVLGGAAAAPGSMTEPLGLALFASLVVAVGILFGVVSAKATHDRADSLAGGLAAGVTSFSFHLLAIAAAGLTGSWSAWASVHVLLTAFFALAAATILWSKMHCWLLPARGGNDA